jgi:uncharacterized protein YwqG
VDALSARGYEQVARRVAAGRTHSVLLRAVQGGTAPPHGSSRIGGTPDLPEAVSWPEADGKSLSFIAQIDLQEVAKVWRGSPLPASGMLYFFYDAEQSVWGFDPADRGKWAVLHSEEPGERLREARFPADLPEHARFAPKVVAPVLETAYPGYDQVELDDLHLSDSQDDEVFEIFLAFPTEEPSHKLFGYPDQIQGDMQLECQLVFHGLYCGDPSGYNDPRARDLEGGASQWRLLLQIDTDRDTEMMWGDAGRLYYWIREGDLAAGAFESSWLILQCY